SRFALPVFVTAPATSQMYSLSLHDALPICDAAERPLASRGRTQRRERRGRLGRSTAPGSGARAQQRAHDQDARDAHGGGTSVHRSEEHTSELQSRENLVCRLLLEKKNNITT